ncbi:hypothetical protein PEBR_05303 [Penicillium brasilianum]|uniref:Uncharacterized protein n=1 Tax=Penicillium brasilianum TaxID=104259 RepID=A0A1S9RXA8_PENBI|nr:hypothetical protein PEBR_05303 [Penicillium brasilianum]
MATAHGSTTHLPTGPMPATAPISADELKEYERILKISDEIFAGSHPRLKVPQQFVRKPAARSSQNGPSAQQVTKSRPAGIPADNVPLANMAQRPQSSQASSATGNAPATSVLNAAAPAFRMASKPTSEIDPIFLTKSDDLVRAEIQLQRQRVERTLRDQLEQKKHDSKQKPAIQDIKPDFDVSDVLDRALEIVRPVSLSDPSEVIGPNDSFDENSFYSSRAPDSPPQPAGGLRKPSPVAPAQPVGAVPQVPVDHYADELQRLEALNRPGSDQEMHDAYPVVHQGAPNHPKPTSSVQPKVPGHLHELEGTDALEEPEYSPPAPEAPLTDPRDYERIAIGDDRGRYTHQIPGMHGVISPANNVKVVRNHITSPAAPRPSRVSPLATAKVPSVQQLRGGRAERRSEQVYSDPDSSRASPSGPAPQIMSRKRRKLHGKEDTHLVSHRTQTAGPSDAYIKEEPVSPPPFADDPAVIPSRQPQERPVYIDIESPQYTPVVERHESMRGPVYESNPYHEIPAEQRTHRELSRLGDRRVVRDDTDLRRVATMQYARPPEYHRGYAEADPRGVRAASYAVVERLPQERSRYYEEVPSSYGPRYVTVDDDHRPAYQDPYYEEHPPVRVMAAPERRYVVDEHGNRFEMVPAPRMQPMAPPPRPMSRAPKADVYGDHVPVRTASVRAASVVQDPYGDHRYVQEMPPPPPTYRRVISDYARPGAGERRAYATPLENHDPYAPNESVQLAEYVPRRPPYVEEHAPPLDRVIRTTSVRPQQVRYEEPMEVVQRVNSVRPGGPSREVSVFVEDRQRGEYVERPYYVREQRYYEGDDGNRMALDGPADPVRHAQSRY